jgi:hypothetical protein
MKLNSQFQSKGDETNREQHTRIEMSTAVEWFQFIVDHPWMEWDFDQLSRNPNVTWEIVEANLSKKWNYSVLGLIIILLYLTV